MNRRIHEIRKIHGLNQQDFAGRLGLTKNFISLLETGSREPSDRTIKDICEKFSVSEDWLRTGQGEMRVPRSREEEIAEKVARVITGDNDLQKAVISMICGRTEKELELLERMLWEIVAAMEKDSGQPEG